MALAPSGPICRHAVDIALTQVGVMEVGNNRGQRVEEYQKSAGAGPGDPWCACFCVWCLKKAAKDLARVLPKGLPLSAYTPDWAEWGRDHGRWITRSDAVSSPDLVDRGDLLLLYKPNLGRIGHIAFVGHAGPEGVWCVEGNTNKAGSREGDGVYKNLRKWGSILDGSGFVRLGV